MNGNNVLMIMISRRNQIIAMYLTLLVICQSNKLLQNALLLNKKEKLNGLNVFNSQPKVLVIFNLNIIRKYKFYKTNFLYGIMYLICWLMRKFIIIFLKYFYVMYSIQLIYILWLFINLKIFKYRILSFFKYFGSFHLNNYDNT